jgi:superoxide dismutase, Cu-Zn family
MRVFIAASFALISVACGREDIDVPVPANPPAATSEPPVPAPREVVELTPTQGHDAAGRLTLAASGEGVRITGTVTGLEPGSVHGIHVHENGDCSAADASSAGGHFAPLGNPHGAPGENSHIGDLGNITANDRGVANVDVRAVQARLGSNTQTDLLGRAIVVHANADDLKSQPSGESGVRIACGVIDRDAVPRLIG